MHTSQVTNGRLRRSLSAEIDRLDTILDGLGEGLNEAIAAAVSAAVQQAIRELLASPQVAQHFRGTAAPAPRTTQRVDWQRRWAVARVMLLALLAAARAGLGRRLLVARAWGSRLATGIPALQRCGIVVLLAVGTAVVTGLASSVAGSWFAGLLGGLGTMVGIVAVRGRWTVHSVSGHAPAPGT